MRGGAPVDVVAAFSRRIRELGRPARILFAEDNPTNQFVAQQLLRGFDVRIDMVGDGAEAVHGATAFLYNVICMDMRMPEMDGLAATRAIRAIGGPLATVPIVALTANAFPEDVAACFDAGMTGFVAKPIRKETFLGALLAALGGDVPGDMGCLTDDACVVTTPSFEPVEAALGDGAFRRLIEEIGADGVAELVTLFEAESRARLRRLEAGDLDRDHLIHELHGLKGAAGAACAVLLRGRAAAMEQRLKDDDSRTEIDIVPLTEAFEAWCAAVRQAGIIEAIAA